MRAGKLDHKIVIQRYTEGEPDPFGNPVLTWSDIGTYRAQVVQTTTEEFIRTYGEYERTIAIFRTWFIPDVEITDRVLFNGIVHNIVEIKETGRRRGHEIRTVSTGQEAE